MSAPAGAAPPDPARPAGAAPTLAQAHALHQAGRIGEAEPLYRAWLLARPDDPDALNLLGVLCHRSDRLAEGLALIDRAIGLAPRSASAHCNRGAALRDLGRLDAALDSVDTALRLDPDHAIAATNRAALLLELQRPAEALAACERVLARRPHDVAAHHHRGRSLQDLGQADAALGAYAQAAAAQPAFIPALDAGVDLLRGLGRLRDALPLCERLCALEPAAAARWHLHGSLLLDLDRPKDALRSFERALALQPEHAPSLHDSGHAWTALGRPDLALEPYRRALALEPELPFLRGQWLHTRLKVGEWDRLDLETARLAQAIEAGAAATAPFPATVLALTEAQLLQAACTYSRQRHGAAAPRLPAWPRGARVRLGYFSPDFHQHALATLCAGLFECHDRSRFEVFGYSFGPPREGALRERLRAGFEHFIDVRDWTDAQIVEHARGLRIDIAIDLAGCTQGAREAIFARRAAPVQVAMMGFPGSSGAAWIDHLIADDRVVPPPSRGHYSEHVVALPHSYLANDAWRAAAGPAPSRASVGLPEPGFVFCAFNQIAKITPAVFGLWMTLLRELDASVLWLLQDNPLATRNLRAAAERAGIDPARLVFAPRVAPAEHLARHGCADLYLDTLPYNAHTSACDALWAGLPVLTRIGHTFAGRVGSSLLHAVGLPEGVVATEHAYVALALHLARHPAELHALKARLVAARSTCALFDTRRYARDLEQAFESMLE